MMTPNPEDHPAESRDNTDNMSHTTLEDYEEVTNTDAHLPVASTILTSYGPTPKTSLDTRE